MLAEAMMALAAAGGSAVVQAAGTDAWTSFRQRVAAWFGRGDTERERAELERLDQTATALTAASPDGVERVRIRQEASWETLFVMLLESLDDAEREQAATQLRALLEEQVAGASSGVSAGAGGVAAGGDISVRAEQGSIAAAVINGGASIGTPSQPDPSQG